MQTQRESLPCSHCALGRIRLLEDITHQGRTLIRRTSRSSLGHSVGRPAAIQKSLAIHHGVETDRPADDSQEIQSVQCYSPRCNSKSSKCIRFYVFPLLLLMSCLHRLVSFGPKQLNPTSAYHEALEKSRRSSKARARRAL
jgi:hypothetical protein